MSISIKRSFTSKLLLLVALTLASIAFAAPSLNISTTPLGTSGGNSVKPNLLFILDDSGSMDRDYTPDYVEDEICQKNMSDAGDTRDCELGEVLYNASGFNSQYYNPQIRYAPPKNADGTEWLNASTTTTLTNPFLDSITTKNLKTTYRNMYWCKNSSDDPTGSTAGNCRQNTNAYISNAGGYPYPDGTYDNQKTNDNGNPYYYTMSGSPSWCSNDNLTTCQAKRTATYRYPKISAAAGVTGVAASQTFYVTKAGGSNTSNKTVTVSLNGSTIATVPSLSYSSNTKNNRNNLADLIVNAINNAGNLYASIISADTSNGSSSCSSGSTSRCAKIEVKNLQDASTSTTNTTFNDLTFRVTSDASNITFSTTSSTKLSGGVDYSPSVSGVIFRRVDIVSTTTTYARAAGRSDCVASTTTCSYDEELQNFANWYSFYRTRMQMMKTSISRSYASITDSAPGVGFRIGLTYISSGASSSEIDSGDTSCWTANKALRLPIGNFDATQKSSFYTKLFAVQTCSSTPLRAALSLAGRVFAGTGYVISSSDPDPIQHSCQQNFAFLSTDGYWNTGLEDENGPYGPFMMDGITAVGDQDGAETGYMKDALGVANTLADVAQYYYTTDLRASMSNDVPISTKDSNSKQHMVTFTMGLGVNGLLSYGSAYETGGSADYTAIGQGTKDWGDPIKDQIRNARTDDERIDDLWHAAVNGRGKYFSAANPTEVTSSLELALNDITATTGAAAAAATSNLEPVAGDNYAYVASYETQTWYGNLEAKEINLTTGELAATSIWSVQSVLDNQSTRYLYTFKSSISGTDKKIPLTWTNAQGMGWDATGTDYFNPTQLPQCATLTNCPGATKENLFNYLMGGADTTTSRAYRARDHILGDIVNSQPVHVKQPAFGYSDSGYSTYKASSRKAMVYVGANDGFLHAFDASTGNEDWAFMPKTVVPELFNLANTSYTHRSFVDGVITVGDIDNGSAWKTVLVGGLNNGGSAYYALDVTDPAAPKALWEFTDSQLGKTYGNPIITKLPIGATSAAGAAIAGKWVALLTSGYNNSLGRGILYVLDAYTGVEYFRIYTCTSQVGPTGCSGSSAAPSGLAKINTWVNDPVSNNTSSYAYGGDLDGNLWRFDLAGKSAFKVAAVSEPITVKPELALVQNNKVVFFGTGLFLQNTDRTDNSTRTIYGIKDNLAASATLENTKTSGALVKQTLSLLTGSTTARTVANPLPVDWTAKSGWFVELLEAGERVNVDPKIQLGTLAIVSNVPDAGSSNTCTAGGYAWINFLDINTGSFVDNSQSNAEKVFGYKISNALAVGVNVIRLGNGKTIAIATTADNKHPVTEVPVPLANLPMKRVSWRELFTD